MLLWSKLLEFELLLIDSEMPHVRPKPMRHQQRSNKMFFSESFNRSGKSSPKNSHQFGNFENSSKFLRKIDEWFDLAFFTGLLIFDSFYECDFYACESVCCVWRVRVCVGEKVREVANVWPFLREKRGGVRECMCCVSECEWVWKRGGERVTVLRM